MSRNPITRRVHIEFISKDTVVITNAYLQKTFHLDKLPNPIYIDLVRLNTIANISNDQERFLANPSKHQSDGSFVLDIIAAPGGYNSNNGNDWQRVGIARMGRFEFWLKGGGSVGGKNTLAPVVEQVVEGTFSVKIVY